MNLMETLNKINSSESGLEIGNLIFEANTSQYWTIIFRLGKYNFGTRKQIQWFPSKNGKYFITRNFQWFNKNTYMFFWWSSWIYEIQKIIWTKKNYSKCKTKEDFEHLKLRPMSTFYSDQTPKNYLLKKLNSFLLKKEIKLFTLLQ